MLDVVKHSSVRSEELVDNGLERKDAPADKQHLSNIEMDKLRNVIKTKVSQEYVISEQEYSPLDWAAAR